jgi:hypothetical protein
LLPLTVKDAEEYPPHIDLSPRLPLKPDHFLFLLPLFSLSSAGRRKKIDLGGISRSRGTPFHGLLTPV